MPTIVEILPQISYNMTWLEVVEEFLIFTIRKSFKLQIPEFFFISFPVFHCERNTFTGYLFVVRIVSPYIQLAVWN